MTGRPGRARPGRSSLLRYEALARRPGARRIQFIHYPERWNSPRSLTLMRLFGRKKWRLQRCRVYGSLALAAYLVAAVGIPVTKNPGKDRSQPFPCQDHACGCRTAADCWHHCCCFSPEEKLAWARSHHVEPPANAEQPAAQGWYTVRLRDQEATRCTHCDHCAASASCCQSDEQPPASPSPRPAGRHWLPGLKALQCQGLNTLWVMGGTVLPAPQPTTWNPYLSPIGWLALPDRDALSLSLTPLDPPPRSRCA
jgi:hypothetical protein